jgi:hypothetical protein
MQTVRRLPRRLTVCFVYGQAALSGLTGYFIVIVFLFPSFFSLALSFSFERRYCLFGKRTQDQFATHCRTFQ